MLETILRLTTKPVEEETILEMNAGMMALERDCCISYDNTFGAVYKDIYEKYPEMFREMTGEDCYISEYERSFMRWALETIMISEGRTTEQKSELRKMFDHLYSKGINYFHPEAYDTIVVGGDSNE